MAVYHVHWERSMDEGRGQLIQPQFIEPSKHEASTQCWADVGPVETTPRVCWEGCLNAGPGAGTVYQVVARLATLRRVCVQLCRPTPAVFI